MFKKLRKEKFDIPKLHNEVYDYAYQKSSEKRSLKSPFKMKLVISLLVIILSIVTIIIIDQTFSYAKYEVDYQVYNVSDSRDLKKIIKDSELNSSKRVTLLEFLESILPLKVAPGVFDETNGFVDTFTQVENVSESDIIKTDGSYIYYACESTREVLIFKADDGTLVLVKEISYQSNSNICDFELYLENNSLIVICQETKGNNLQIDIFNTEDFRLEKSFNQVGSLIDSRVYNNYLYIVSNQFIDQDTFSNPQYKVDGVVEEVSYSDCIYSKYSENSSYTFITSINLSDYSVKVNTQLGNSHYDVIYMSENKLYLVSPKYNDKVGKVISTIYAYDVTLGHAQFFGFAFIDGVVQNQWYLSEYQSRLRIAYSNNYSSDKTKINRIIIFDINEDNKSFDQVGYLEDGLGKANETIKSVLFDKNTVEIVTYYRTDPLYKIELVDGVTPVIISELSMPGYNSFLVDFYYNSQRYLVGLGYTDFGSFKVSLYSSEDQNIQIGEDLVFEMIYQIEGIEKSSTLFIQEVEDGLILGTSVKGSVYHVGEESYPIDTGYMVFLFSPDNLEPIQLLKYFPKHVERMVYIDGYYYLLGVDFFKSYIYQDGAFIN